MKKFLSLLTGVLLLFGTSRARDHRPCLNCNIAGVNTVQPGETDSFYVPQPSVCNVTSWTVSCGTVKTSTSGYAVIYFNALSCTSATITAYSDGTVVSSKIVTIVSPPPLDPGTISNTAQTINFNTVPGQINASPATSGSCGGAYTYQWESSTDNDLFNPISGANGQNYQPQALNATTYFRRRTSCSIEDYATWNTAVVNVYPQVVAGTISPGSQTINYNTAPTILSLSGTTGGNGSYTITWQSSPDAGFASPSEVGSGTTYSPVPLIATTWYRAMVNSNGAIAYSAAVPVYVLPQLVTGTINPLNQSVNYQANALLSLSGTLGGDGNYSYQWYSDVSGSFQPVSGANGSSYTSGPLTNITHFYVVTGSNGVNVTSGQATVNVYPQLISGTLSPISQTIDYNTIPATISVSGVNGGNGTYTYQWYSDASGSFQPVDGATNSSYTPGALTAQTYFYLVTGSNGGYVTSVTATVEVGPAPIPGIITPANITIATGTSPGTLTCTPAQNGTGVFTYRWQYSSDGINWNYFSPDENTLSLTLGNIFASTYYHVEVNSGGTRMYTTAAQVIVGAANLDLNYIRTRTINRPGITDKGTSDGLTDPFDVQQVTTYFDGLGRPVQTVSMKQSPQGRDLVAIQEYDPFGRETNHYLPFSTAADGLYKPYALAVQNAFNNSQYPGEKYYYGQTVFESSPLDRPLTTFSPGNSWIGGNRGVANGYFGNTADDSVQIWNIGFTSGDLPINAGTYPEGELYKNTTSDEQGHQVIEYKDKEGHVVLKKAQLWDVPAGGHSGWLCTYYVYDDLSNLRFAIPPKAVEWLLVNGWNFATSDGVSVASELCFRYEYDARNRMIVKQVPGKGEDWTVYDVRDRQVFTQDAIQRSQHQWINTQYDNLDRTVLVGQMNYQANRVDLQQTITSMSTTGGISPLLVADLYLLTPNQQGDTVATDAIDMWDGFSTLANGSFSASIVPAGSATGGYPSGALPIVLNPVPAGVQVQPLIINYYDNYDWVAATGSGLGTALATDKTGSSSYFITGYNTYPEYAVPVAASPAVRGQMTGTMHLVLNENRPLYTINFYDDRARMIQSRSINYTGGVDTATTQYDFSGKPLRSLFTHYKSGAGPQYHTELTKTDYDAGFRLLHVWKNIDAAPVDQLISTQQYNELGQLTTKTLGNNLDNLNYNYNIRGWLNSINQDYISSTSSTPLHYFGLQLGYDMSQAGPAGTSFKNLQYNGNISGWIWRSAGDGVKRQYDFTYDNINRLTGADFNQKFPGGWGKSDPSNSALAMDYSVSIPQYDANGNIMQMVQKGFRIGKPIDAIDDLTYRYSSNSNKLAGVNDAANDPTSKLGDFHYNAATKDTADYSYDVNGNLITDKNKNITGIVYNYVNLPQQITITGKGTISYTYDATGNKLKKTTIDNTVTPSKTTVTTYIGGIQYQNDSLQFIGHEEGRARWALHNYTSGATGFGWEYDFFEKDHLGNTRVVLTQQKDTAQYMATMEATYRAKEMALFYNVDSTSYPASSVPGGFPDIGPPTPNDSIARVSGSPGSHKMGPALLLKVMTGDSVAFGSKYFYHSNSTPGPSHSSVQDVMTSLAQGLLSIAGGGHGAMSDLNNTSGSPVYAALNNFLPASDTIGTDKPKAYLNWMLLDNQFNYVADQSGAQQVGSPDILNPPLAQALKLNHSGYLYIWVSNGTENWDVFFDNLAVTHYSGPLVEETHYYPGGLTMAGISDKALKTNYAENKYRYNKGSELQNKEFSDGSGLEMYETHLRELDPQLDRWWQADPKTDQAYESVSPYAAMNNDPIRYNDPNGDEGEACCGLTFTWENVKNNLHQDWDHIKEFGHDFGLAALNSAGSTMNGMVSSSSGGTWSTNPAQTIFNVNTDINQSASSMGQSVGLPLPGPSGPSLPNASSAVAVASDGLAIAKGILAHPLLPISTVNAGGTPSLKEQGENIKNTYNDGKNSVTIQTPDKQIRYDLAGASHNGIETPHLQVYKKNFVDGVMLSKSKASKDPVPMTQQDLRNVIRYFQNAIKNQK